MFLIQEGIDVSIHARVERATTLYNGVPVPEDVSIHARVERATGRRLYFRPGRLRFNPRTRRACDNCKGGLIMLF